MSDAIGSTGAADDAPSGPPQPADAIARLSTELAVLQARLNESRDEAWYKKPATLISVAAFVFSLGTTAFSAYDSHQEDIRANRRDVRALLQRLSKLPLENYELLQKVRGSGDGESLSGMINQENVLLSNQAAELIERYPNSFTSTEYFAVAFALAASNVVTKVPVFYQRAIDSATSSVDYNSAARAYAGFLYSKGELTEGRRLYALALNVWPRFPERNAFIVNSIDLLTLLYWSQSEFSVGNRSEAREKLDLARKRLAAMPPGPQTDVFRSQIDFTARFVD